LIVSKVIQGRIEIIGDEFNESFGRAQLALQLCILQRNQFNNGFVVFGNNDLLARNGFLHQFG